MSTATRFGTGAGTATAIIIIDPEAGPAIEFTSDLGPGASGGALLDAKGRVLGVIRGAVDDDPAHTVAVPVARVRGLIDRGAGEHSHYSR